MRTNQFDDRLEQATRARLARLAATPVDTSRLERQLEGAMGKAQPAPAIRVAHWWAPLTGIAAIVIISVTIGVLFLTVNDTPITATPSLLTGLHHEVVEGGPFSIPVADIDHANQELASRWPDAPTLPITADCEVGSCCIHSVKGRKIACVLLRLRGKPVTMIVAHRRDLTPVDGVEATRGNQRYVVQAEGGVNIVCMQKNGTSVWLVGEFPHEELVQLLPKEWRTS